MSNEKRAYLEGYRLGLQRRVEADPNDLGSRLLILLIDTLLEQDNDLTALQQQAQDNTGDGR